MNKIEGIMAFWNYEVLNAVNNGELDNHFSNTSLFQSSSMISKEQYISNHIQFLT